jgi:hypothetical protein
MLMISGARLEQGRHAPRVACEHGVAQARDRHTVGEGFQLRPAVEAVRAREHELRVVQRERRGVGVAVVQVNLGHRVGVAGAKRGQQFLGLAPELIEIGMLAQRTSGRGVA